MKCRVKAIPDTEPKTGIEASILRTTSLLRLPSLDRLTIETHGSLPEAHNSQLVMVDGVGVDEGSEFAVETIRAVNLSSVVYGGQTK